MERSGNRPNFISHSLILSLLTWSIGLAPVWAGEFKAQNMVILVIDGPRHSGTWGERSRKYIPHQAGDLAPLGVLNAHFYNDGPTYTNAGHTALTTGFYQPIPNDGSELPKKPGLFQLFLQKNGWAVNPAKGGAWVVASKDKLKILVDCQDQEWKGRYLASYDCGKNGQGPGYREDPETLRVVQRVLKEHQPRLLLINFKEPDSSGHEYDWKGYLKGIRDSDEGAWKVWGWLQKDPFYRDKTAFFVTNDHGRHLDGHMTGFKEHGDCFGLTGLGTCEGRKDCPKDQGCCCEGCRRISLLALGPDFQRGETTKQRAGQIDLAVTAARILGVSLPGSKGRFMSELFPPSTPTKNSKSKI